MQSIRPPAVAGMFYPGEAGTLAHDVRAMLASAKPAAHTPKALIVPHAGYIYSGPIAATGYATLKDIAPRIRRVVLLGPAHRVATRGLALPGSDAFTTPLGTVEVDKEAIQVIANLPYVTISRQTHAQEHSLEVQLPFLQTVLSDFKILPLVVGAATSGEVAEVLERLWGNEETLIVVSSDLSHYLPYDTARRVDGATVKSIQDLNEGISHEQACGATPINGLILAARRHHLSPHLLDVRNSGDTAGPRDGVVGYAAFAFTSDAAPGAAESATNEQEMGATLLNLARSAIAERFGSPPNASPNPEWLNRQGAVFVTLTRNGQLRGCIGSLEAHRPLLQDVQQNALASAFHDPRFAPLSADEFNDVKVEVSLLTSPEPMVFQSEQDALRQLRPNVDGVIFQYGPYRSTFLPQVWEQLREPGAFMAHLKNKAGLSPTFWSSDVRLFRYTVKKWKE